MNTSTLSCPVSVQLRLVHIALRAGHVFWEKIIKFLCKMVLNLEDVMSLRIMMAGESDIWINSK